MARVSHVLVDSKNLWKLGKLVAKNMEKVGWLERNTMPGMPTIFDVNGCNVMQVLSHRSNCLDVWKSSKYFYLSNII